MIFIICSAKLVDKVMDIRDADPDYLYWVAGSDNFGPEVRKIAESAGSGYLPEREPVEEKDLPVGVEDGLDGEKGDADAGDQVFRRPGED